MRIFDINPLFEQIREDLEAGLEPNPKAVALLIAEGPSAIETWIDSIDEVKAERDGLEKRIKELGGRLLSREITISRMQNALMGTLLKSFGGRVKTALVTVWVQDTTSFDVTADYTLAPQFFTLPEPKLRKREVIEAYKNLKDLPPGITVKESITQSLRIKR